LKKVADLEQERKLLQDGQPCPLCGSVHHPYAKGQVPGTDKAQLAIRKMNEWINEMARLDEHIHTLSSEEQAAFEEKIKASSEALRVQHDYDTLDYDHRRLSEELEELKSQQKTATQKLETALIPFGMAGFKEISNWTDILDQLTERVRQWTQLQKDNRTLENQRQEIKGTCDRLEAVIDTMKNSHDDLVHQQSAIQKRIYQLTQQRQALLGSQNPADEEAQLEKEITEAEKESKNATKQLNQVQQDKKTIQAQIITLKESQEKREVEWSVAQAVFEKDLKKANLEDEAAFLASRMPEAKREEIASQAEELDRQAAELNGKIKDNQQRLSQEIKRNITTRPLDELNEQNLACEEQLAKVRETLGAAKQQQSDYEKACEWIKDKQAQINKKTRECQRWAVLHELIGSADGKKFRNFAQGLTFERMIAQANRQLSHMSDRYLLVRDEQEPLELDVIDNYQAGEIRSTKNLSGGESFIVSLALALGLSKMSSRQVRVDSLFLDEGFGTLDDDALEMALETLSSLQHDGKIIGIISHVPAIKERIRTQLAIRPISGGKSVIDGPGVHRGQ
jgi:DNA repair protein SbcC/Rad50